MVHRCGPAIILTFVARAAFANSFGSLDKMPIATGELRFVQPKLITSGSTSRTEVGFPLEKTTLRGFITGTVAGLELEQVFSNPGERAAVHDYEMVIGERTVRGTIDTKNKKHKPGNRCARSTPAPTHLGRNGHADPRPTAFPAAESRLGHQVRLSPSSRARSLDSATGPRAPYPVSPSRVTEASRREP